MNFWLKSTPQRPRRTCYSRVHIRIPVLLEQGYSNVIDEYACVRRFHYVLLEIKLERGVVNVLDSRRKDPQTYADMTKILNK